MTQLQQLNQIPADRFQIPSILRKIASASRQLAELKGVASSIPNQTILISSLGLQEAKDSSAIENIVTTHDELFRDDLQAPVAGTPAAKEVLRYRQALWTGYDRVRESGILTLNHLMEIQEVLEQNRAGFRRLPGTALKDGLGQTVYTPPQDPDEILRLMRDLEQFINGAIPFDADPLLKMCLIHHQFESIHPFYDGNGRTGRILNVLYLVKEQLLSSPVLYLSSHIVRTKDDYYRLLQSAREEDRWEDWVMYMLDAVEQTSAQTIGIIHSIWNALLDYKHRIRSGRRFYSQDLINSLFTHPYTKIEHLERSLNVSRITAMKYLDALAADGFLLKKKIGRSNFYINIALNDVLTRQH